MANISIVPLGATIGARVEGIDFSEPPTDALRDAIRAAVGEHKVLVFKGEPLPFAVFRAFARKFGLLQEHVLRKYRHDEFPDLYWLTNVAEDGSFDPFGVVRTSTWHSDRSYTQDPPELGMLHAFEVPSRGSSTVFADMCNAYDTLDADMQSRMSGLTGLYRHGAGPGGSMYENVLDDDQEEKTNDAVHPTVSVHPSTGQKMLYLNETHTRKFRELEPKDSVALLQKVITHATCPENIYLHQWSVGDLLIWDQQSSIRRGAGDFPPDERRVRIRAIVEEFD